MSQDRDDPVLEAAIAELRRLPPVRAASMQRVIEAAAVARVTAADEPAPFDVPVRSRRVRFQVAAAIAVAAGIVGFVARGAWLPGRMPPAAVSTMPAAATPVRAAADAGGVRPLLKQFVYESRTAHRIALVGDFNQWNPTVAPMARSGDGSLWSVVVPVLPGRHVYAFMVDDSILALDPREPQARDPDLGTRASVVIVGRP